MKTASEVTPRLVVMASTAIHDRNGTDPGFHLEFEVRARYASHDEITITGSAPSWTAVRASYGLRDSCERPVLPEFRLTAIRQLWY